MTSYIRFLLIFIWLPLALLWFAKGRLFWQYRKTIALVVLATFVFGVPWDTLSVISGLWWYNASPTLGIWIGPWLPLEEYLFTLTFPILLASFILLLRQYVRS
jgi:lycopene cyclase domain-containing protein